MSDRERSIMRFAVPAFFLLVLLVGIVAAPSYGISWDEKAMYVLGRRVYEFVFHGGSYPSHPGIRFHGSLFEFLMYSTVKMLQINYARHIFIVRHFMNYLTFVGAVAATYAIAKRHFKSTVWGLIAAVMLFLSPRQFGHAFFNSRDIPTMALWALAMLTLFRLREHRTPWRAAQHGIACGLALAMRMPSVFLPVFTVFMLACDWLKDRHAGDRRANCTLIVSVAVMVVASALAMVAFWPLLWAHPLRNFSEALYNMAFEQNAAGGFFFGNTSGKTPWYWVPVWMVITIPLSYSLLFIAGTVIKVRRIVRQPSTLFSNNGVLILLWYFGPIMATIVLQSPLFDEWRHVYFVYPAVIIIACTALRSAWDWARVHFPRYGAKIVAGFIMIQMFMTATWMVVNHPYQYVYFSIPSRFVEGEFELDFWGTCFKEGYEMVLAMDDARHIPVAVLGSSGTDNFNMLTREQRRRVLPTAKIERGKYVIDNFRGRSYERMLPDMDKIGSIYVSGMEICALYKNPKWDQTTFDPQAEFNDELVILAIDPNLLN